MKSNYAKYLILFLGIAGLFTNCISNAFWTRPNAVQWCRSGVFPNCSDYPFNSRDVYFGNAGTNYDDLNEINYLVGNGNSQCYECYSYTQGKYYTKSTTASNGGSIISGNLKTFNDGDFLAWRVRQNNGTAFYGYVAFEYNFINYYKDGDTPVYAWWYDLGKKYNSVSYAFLPELPDVNGTGDYFYFNQPRHGSRIFYNYFYDIDLKTVQYIGNQVLTDKFIYVDSLSTTDNIWLVDTNLNKAWSMSESDVNIISDFLFGGIKFTDEVLNNAGRQKSYTIALNEGGNSFLPPTYGNFTASVNTSSSSSLGSIQGMKSYKGANIGLTYQEDFDFVNPNYGNGGSSTSTGSVSDGYFTYEQCLSYTNDISTMANYQKSCRNAIDYQCTSNTGCLSLDVYNDYRYAIQNADFLYIDNIYTGNHDCNMWFAMSWTLYNRILSGGNNLGSLNYGGLISSVNAYSNSDEVFDNVNYCKQLNDVSGDTWLCKFTGIGCDDSFGSIYDMVKTNIKPFITEPIDEVVREFDRGYNFIGSGNNSCIEPYGKTYIWGNYFVVVLVGLFVIFLYGIFKE